TFLVCLRSAQADHQAGARKLQVLDIETDELAAAERASDADEQQRAIAQLEKSPVLARARANPCPGCPGRLEVPARTRANPLLCCPGRCRSAGYRPASHARARTPGSAGS